MSQKGMFLKQPNKELGLLERKLLKKLSALTHHRGETGGPGESGLAGLQLEPDCREELQASQNAKTPQQAKDLSSGR